MAEANSTELTVVRGSEIQPYRTTISVDEIVDRSRKIEQCMQLAMKPGVHYGVIPGTGNKPTLLKPGAEKLDALFQFRPEFRDVEEREPDGHMTITSYCTLVHIPSGDALVKDASGSCSTHESKYAWRKGERECPECGQATILKGRNEGEGWFCWKKRGGCGAKFDAMDSRIVSQQVGRIPNPDLPDQWNTIRKMAQKRAHINAALAATGASDMFTQDLEDMVPGVVVEGEPGADSEETPQSTPRPAPKPVPRVAKPAQTPTEAKGAPAPMLNGIRKAAQRHQLTEAQIAGHYSGDRVQSLGGLTFEEGRTALAELQDAALGELAWAKAPERGPDLPEALLPIVEHFQGDLEETALGVAGVLGREINTNDLKTLGAEELGRVAEALLAH